MEMYDVIKQKRDGMKLTKEQIEFFVSGCTDHTIPDYQTAALLMAIFLNGMDMEETMWLTHAMKDSGETLNLSGISGIKVDKHSTGGVGDKTSIVVAPIVASCGVPVAKMSGRGLGFTGGTIDKLEAIPGYETSIDIEKFIDLVNRNGIALIGQTAEVAAADKIIYGLRDVTATVDNMSLISSSIMSKKLALGSDAILLDVKCGGAAFMNNEEDARQLGTMMHEIGKSFDKKVACIISRMEEPLGYAVGNGLEVSEAIDVLMGKGPEDLVTICTELAGALIYMGEAASSQEEGKEMAEKAIASGAGLEKLRAMIEGQGGDVRVIEDRTLLGIPRHSAELVCKTEGYVNKIDGMKIGLAAMRSGAGRSVAGEKIDREAGILLNCKKGSRVSEGDVLCRIYGMDESKVDAALQEAEAAFEISDREPEINDIIIGTIGL